ncbi:alpha/beta hydrolase [Halobacillus rhizosphaerae]|uniref:alpha/beta hydrolase n=1 Tax=Halobacillus rhizosphaerae TaxID=3064889 RepID=UPI00398AE944
MKSPTYTELLNTTLAIYADHGSLEAYHYITKHAAETEGLQAQIYNFRYSLAAASGLADLALNIMKEAVIERQYWYSWEYLQEDEDLDPLRKYPEFLDMLRICKEREKRAKAEAKPELKVIAKASSERQRRNLVITLHGDQENNEITEKYWNSITSNTYSLALPQSSQVEFSDGYSWHNAEKGMAELQQHYQQVISIEDYESIIVGGFSAGAGIVLKALLNGQVEADGFILASPWLSEIETWKNKFALLKEKGIKGYIICGDQDSDCLEHAEKLIDLLTADSIPHQFHKIPHVDHDYPKDFGVHLTDALTYLTEA